MPCFENVMSRFLIKLSCWCSRIYSYIGNPRKPHFLYSALGMSLLCLCLSTSFTLLQMAATVFCFCLNFLFPSGCSKSFNLCIAYVLLCVFSYRYLSALISQSFLDIGSLSRILDSIMKLCLQFCWSIENQENGANTSELEHLTEVHFLVKTNYIFQNLSSTFEYFFSFAWFRNSTRNRTLYIPYCEVAD